MDRPQDSDELLRKLKIHRKNILLALHRKGELPTSELREKSGFPTGSRNHHLGILQDWDLIEEIGRVGEENERVFGLTDYGESFTEEYLAEELSDDIERRLDSIETRMAEVEEEDRRLQERFEKLKEYVATAVES